MTSQGSNQASSNQIAKLFLAEIEGEFDITRRVLERLPEDKLNWRPHEKSLTAGQLAAHIASILHGVLGMALEDSAELPDFSKFYQPSSKSEILSTLSESKRFAEENLIKLTDARMHEPFSLTQKGTPVMELQRGQFLRTVLLNHWYHHRGQFTVYLRLLNISVPSIYGPSADEAPGA